jgi:hypothetical protein
MFRSIHLNRSGSAETPSHSISFEAAGAPYNPPVFHRQASSHVLSRIPSHEKAGRSQVGSCPDNLSSPAESHHSRSPSVRTHGWATLFRSVPVGYFRFQPARSSPIGFVTVLSDSFLSPSSLPILRGKSVKPFLRIAFCVFANHVAYLTRQARAKRRKIYVFHR